MEINQNLIDKVAALARLNLSEEEKKKFVEDFKEILTAFSKLDEIDTKKTKGVLQPVELKNFMREDKSEKSLTQEEALSNTNLKEEGYFKGPKAI